MFSKSFSFASLLTFLFLSLAFIFNCQAYLAPPGRSALSAYVAADITAGVGIILALVAYGWSSVMILLGNGKSFLWMRLHSGKDDALVQEGKRQCSISILVGCAFLLLSAFTTYGLVMKALAGHFSF